MTADDQFEFHLPAPPVSGETPLVPARMVNEFVYCPRLAYLMWTQAEWSESGDAVEGRRAHTRVDKPNAPLPAPETLEDDDAAAQRVVSLTAAVDNETPVHTALLLYKGRALAGLGLKDAAVETFTAALRRRKDRSEDLLRQIRYERAVVYEGMGRKAAARREFERLYAEAPDFEDVARRLGLAS